MLHMENLFQIKLLGILFEYFQQRTSFSKLVRNKDFLMYAEKTKRKQNSNWIYHQKHSSVTE